jgi:hypothetical protein
MFCVVFYLFLSFNTFHLDTASCHCRVYRGCGDLGCNMKSCIKERIFDGILLLSRSETEKNWA